MRHGFNITNCGNRSKTPLFNTQRNVWVQEQQARPNAKAEQPFSLNERAKMIREKIQEPVSASTQFAPNPDLTFHNLAELAYPEKPDQIARYATKIKRSLEKHLAEKNTIDTLWKYLNEQGCTNAEIKEGILRFFKEQKDEQGGIQKTIIDITKFLAPMRIPAESSLDKAHTVEKNNLISKTKADLRSLLAELQGQLPAHLQQISNIN